MVDLHEKILDKISEETGISKKVVRKVVSNHLLGIRSELKYGEKSRINILGLGVWRVNPMMATHTLKYQLLPYARIYKNKIKEVPDNEYFYNAYQDIKEQIRYIWRLRRDALNYKYRRNSKYYPSNELHKKENGQES